MFDLQGLLAGANRIKGGIGNITGGGNLGQGVPNPLNAGAGVFNMFAPHHENDAPPPTEAQPQATQEQGTQGTPQMGGGVPPTSAVTPTMNANAAQAPVNEAAQGAATDEAALELGALLV